MKFDLDEQQRDFAASIDAALGAADLPAAVRAWAAGDTAPGRKVWTQLADLGVTALMVPEEVTIIPNFFMMRWAGLVDTHWPLILLPTFGPQGIMATFLMRQYFLALPKELEDAGKMDGLSRLGVWWSIALPMSRPALAAVAIITFLNSWNLFLEPLIFVSSLEKFTLPLALSNFTDPYGMPLWHLQLAATSLAVIPILIVYLIAQRQIIESFALSGVKG